MIFLNYNCFKKELLPSGHLILCLPLRRNSIGRPHGGLKKLQLFFSQELVPGGYTILYFPLRKE